MLFRRGSSAKPRIMSSSNIVRSHRHCFLEKQTKLYFLVAHHVRIRGNPPPISSHHIIHNRSPVLLLEIKNIKRNTEVLRGAPSVFRVRLSTTIDVIALHMYPDNIKTTLQEKRGGNRRVNATRHGYEYPSARLRVNFFFWLLLHIATLKYNRT